MELPVGDKHDSYLAVLGLAILNENYRNMFIYIYRTIDVLI